MISSYRLGDLCMLTLQPHERDTLCREHPESIGADLVRSNVIGDGRDIGLIYKVVQKHLEKSWFLLPHDVGLAAVVHLRLGDVVAGTRDHELEKRPIDIDVLKRLIPEGCPRYVIGRCFFAHTSSGNRDECIAESNKYLQRALQELAVSHFDSGSADLDLLCAVQARHFIQGKGYFSKLIAAIRKESGRGTIV